MLIRSILIRCSQFLRNSVALIFLSIVASMGIALSFILATGPEVQRHLIALVNGTASSIYGTSYKEAFVHFPSLSDWLRTGISWPYLIMGAVIAFAAARYTRPRSIYSITVLSSWIILLTYDVINGAAYGLLSQEYLFENAISNLIGGAIIAALLILALIIRDSCYENMVGGASIRRFVSLSILAIFGILTSTTIFYLLTFFYQPVPVSVDLLVDHPISGMIVVDKDDDTLEENGEEQAQFFSLVPVTERRQSYSWNSPRGQLGADWMALDVSTKYDAFLELHAGCYSVRDLKDRNGEKLKLDNITRLSISFDEGDSKFETIPDSQASGSLALELDKTSLFWSKRNSEKPEEIEVTQFIENARIIYTDNAGLVEFYLSASLFGGADDNLKASSRSLVIQTNKGGYRVSVLPPNTSSPEERIKCQNVDTISAIKTGSLRAPKNAPFIGITVRIQSTSEKTNKGNLVVSGGDGWLTMEKMDSHDLSTGSGKIDFLSFTGNTIKMNVDGTAADFTPYESFSIYGTLDGDFDGSARMRVSGIAELLWKDRTRLSPTRWEQIPWEARTLLLSIASIVLLFVGKPLFARMHKNTQFLDLSKLSQSTS